MKDFENFDLLIPAFHSAILLVSIFGTDMWIDGFGRDQSTVSIRFHCALTAGPVPVRGLTGLAVESLH